MAFRSKNGIKLFDASWYCVPRSKVQAVLVYVFWSHGDDKYYIFAYVYVVVLLLSFLRPIEGIPNRSSLRNDRTGKILIFTKIKIYCQKLIFEFQQSMMIYAKVILPSQRKMLVSLAFFGGRKIYTDYGSNYSSDYIRVCNDSAIKLLKDTITTLCLLVTCNCLYMIFPMYSMLFKNEIQLPLPIFLPFTEFKGTIDIILNVSVQLYISLYGIIGNFGIEIMTCLIKNTIWATVVAICYSIDMMVQSIEAKKSDYVIDQEFRAILIQMQDYDG